MNELYVSDCYLYFETRSDNKDEALDQLMAVCSANGIQLIVDKAVLRDSNGEEMEENKNECDYRKQRNRLIFCKCGRE